ncbi:MAG: NADH-quinone oxidoreductase subunit L [Polyangiaceae bacterium]|nr:NADH-quinone oxidoreductase subunit L [Polyangiaceae bacterium]
MNSLLTLSSAISWICFVVPGLYLASAALTLRSWPHPLRVWTLASRLSGLAVIGAALLAFGSAFAPPVADPLGAFFGLTFAEDRVLSVRTDLLSGVMLLLVSFVGWVVMRFSRRYLDGDPEQMRYLARLSLTLAAVCLLVCSNNLLMIAVSWFGTSLALHGLLTHFRERLPAQIAAHKKFLLSRLADVCLLGAVALIASSFGTLELDKIFERVQHVGALPTNVAWACGFIAVSALLKCAQLPFHGWLIQVMEAPTPVSALLHAGVVNIGGFVLLRLAPLMTHAEAAQGLLLLVGAVTASVASLVMLTRISIKVMLAWSTCAQMGLMLVECALGAYEMALLHLVAHSLYKAHAFLSAGGAVASYRVAAMSPRTQGSAFGVQLLLGGACSALLAGGLSLVGVHLVNQPAHWFPLAMLALALPSLLLKLPQQQSLKSLAFLALAGLGVALAFALSHLAFGQLVPTGVQMMPVSTPAAAFATANLALLFVIHAWVRRRPESRFSLWLYPRAFAGFYLDELFTRLTFRLWPAKLPASLSIQLALPQPQESLSS